MRRILHLINGEHFSGAERVQDLLAQGLPRHGYAVEFVCLKPDKFPRLRSARDAPLFEIPMHSRVDLGCARRVCARVGSRDYALLHSHTPRAALIGRLVASALRIPTVHHVHSPAGKDSERRLSNLCNAAIEAWSVRNSRLIAVSESLGARLTGHGVNGTRVSVVHNGVPVVGALPERDPPSGPWTLGVVALFRPRKGLEVLLQSLGALAEENLSFELLAVGPFESPRYGASLKSLARRLGIDRRIRWLGFSPNVHAQYRQMDALVLPSLYGEGTPMVLMEAMAEGVPVVASRVEGTPEMIRDGVDGLLVEPGSVVSLRDALRALIAGERPWQALRESAHARQAQLFSAQSMAAGVAAVYDEMLR